VLSSEGYSDSKHDFQQSDSLLYSFKEKDFSDCIDTKSDGGQTMSGTTTGDYHTAYENQSNLCHENDSQMNQTIDSASMAGSRRASIDLDASGVDVSIISKFGGMSQSQPFVPKSTWNIGATSFMPQSCDTKQAVEPQSTATGGENSKFGLDSLSLNNNFTPSTPYVHKFRTEMCKNFQMYGKCKYGDEVSNKIQTNRKAPKLGDLPNYSNSNNSKAILGFIFNHLEFKFLIFLIDFGSIIPGSND
jgi:hypothetical protein